MTRSLFSFLLLSLLLRAEAQGFVINLTVAGVDQEVVTLYTYDDLFTLRTTSLCREMISSSGPTRLTGSVKGTARVQLRIGERTADLYLRNGSTFNLHAAPLPGALSLNGSSRLELTFSEIDALDVNALTSDLNERIDAFVAEDLATDEAAGMQALDITRKSGGSLADSTERPPTLFVNPVLSAAKVDTFTMKLDRFYTDVDDPWFQHYLTYSKAGLHVGPRVKPTTLHERFIKDLPVYYDDPEYVRFLRNLYGDQFDLLDRYDGEEFKRSTRSGTSKDLVALLQRNTLLEGNAQLAELVMLDQLYLNYAVHYVEPAIAEQLLADVEAHSSYPEHRVIAGNMIWDLTAMRPGSGLPGVRLEDVRGTPVELSSVLEGPVCIMLTASWCTSCAKELGGLVKLAAEYPDVIKVVVIGLDQDLEMFNTLRKRTAANSFQWLHAGAEQELRDQWRIRSLPTLLLLNDSTIARSPAPLPSEGLGALFHAAQVESERGGRVKVWDD